MQVSSTPPLPLNVTDTLTSRSIPGGHFSQPSFGKKPVRSVRLRDWHAAPKARSSPTRIEQAFGFPVRHQTLANLGVNFLAACLSLILVHLIAFALAPDDHNLSLLWTDLTRNDLGLVLTYGALVALLASRDEKSYPSFNAMKQLTGMSMPVFGAMVLVGLLTTFSHAGTISLAMLLASGALTSVARFLWFMLEERSRSHSSSSGQKIKNVLVVGTGRTAHEVANHLIRDPHEGRVFRGFLSSGPGGCPHVLGSVEDIGRISRAEFIDEVIVAAPQCRMAELAIAESLKNHLDIKIVPDTFGVWPQLALGRIGSVPVLSLHEEPIPDFDLLVKRSMDTVISLICLLFLLPLMAVLALLIELDSPGPVFYCAPRAGKKGKRFICYKFRTMVTDADERKTALRGDNQRRGPTFKIEHDPRITRVGSFLRRYSLDELPQLWNVLTGTMSLVGPRPHPLDDCEQYQLPDLRRLDVAPGITGLWQVTARRDPSFQTNMALDLEYIESWSLWMDLRILLKTIPVALSGSGS